MSISPRLAVLDLPLYRAGRTPADTGRSTVPEALARLASNESPFGPLPHVARRLEDQLHSINRYPQVRSASLRAKIADSLGVDADHVAAGAGSTGLLWQIAQAFLDEHSEMITPWPSFEGYPLIAQLMGAELRRVPLRDHVVDATAICAEISERTKLVVIAQPNNPTSTKLDQPSLDVLVTATAGRCMLVLDEAYIEFDPSVTTTRSLRMLQASPHVVVLRTFSKAHGLAGLRVGYAVARPHVIDLIDRVAPPFSVSSLAQAAAIASLEAVDEMNERVAAVLAERDRVLAELASLVDGIPASSTNFVWIPCGDQAAHLAARLEHHGVFTRPVAGSGVRVTIGDPVENDRFLVAIRRVLPSSGAYARTRSNARGAIHDEPA